MPCERTHLWGSEEVLQAPATSGRPEIKGGGVFEFYTPTGCENFWGSGGGGGGAVWGGQFGRPPGGVPGGGGPRGMKGGGALNKN